MAGYNRIIMVGNLTRDPELKTLSSGISVARLGLAANRQYKNRQGELAQEVCFVDVDVWGAQAENCNKYLQKGRPVLVEGRLKFDTWKDQEGNTRSKHAIVADSVQFLGAGQQTSEYEQRDSFGGEGARSEPQAGGPHKEPSAATAASESGGANAGSVSSKKLDEPPFDDDLPF